MAGRKPGIGSGLNFDPDADLVEPIDFLILGALPEEGSIFAGAYPDGRTSKQLSKELFDGQIRAGQIGPRMNALVYHGCAVKRKGIGVGGAHIYQRTEKGKRTFEEWQNGREAS